MIKLKEVFKTLEAKDVPKEKMIVMLSQVSFKSLQSIKGDTIEEKADALLKYFNDNR